MIIRPLSSKSIWCWLKFKAFDKLVKQSGEKPDINFYIENLTSVGLKKFCVSGGLHRSKTDQNLQSTFFFFQTAPVNVVGRRTQVNTQVLTVNRSYFSPRWPREELVITYRHQTQDLRLAGLELQVEKQTHTKERDD